MKITRNRATGVIVAALAVVALAGFATAAQATVSDTPAAEYPFTHGSSSTWWFNYSNPGSSDYVLCFVVYDNGIQQTTHDTDCTTNLGYGSGTIWYQWSGHTLVSGHNYSVTANEWYCTAGIGCADGTHDSYATTIDNSPPSVQVAVDGTATYTNNPQLALHINYSDASWPWTDKQGYSNGSFGMDYSPPDWDSSTFDCIQEGSSCTPGSTPDPNCSHQNMTQILSPTIFTGNTNSFDCTASVSGKPDGKWYFCVKEADDALPDAGTSTWVRSSNPLNANVSGAACGYITVDTTPPTLAPSADHTTANAGQLVNFTAGGTDSGSGVNTSSYAWSFGDNTANVAGATATHTYTQAGTYQVTLTGQDNAGNSGSGHVTITVTAASSNGGSSGSGGSGASGGGSGSGGSGASGSGTPGANSTSSTQTSVGGLQVSAPAAVSHKAHTLKVTVSGAGGAVTLKLLKGSEVIATGHGTAHKKGSHTLTLKLPKGLKPGAYKLRITFKTHGKTTSETLTVTLT
jgi:PKD repeat protein